MFKNIDLSFWCQVELDFTVDMSQKCANNCQTLGYYNTTLLQRNKIYSNAEKYSLGFVNLKKHSFGFARADAKKYSFGFSRANSGNFGLDKAFGYQCL